MCYFSNRNHPSGRILPSPLLQIKKTNISESWGYSSKTLWPMSKQKVWKPYPSHPSVWAISTPLCWAQTKSTTQNRYLFSVSSSYPDAPRSNLLPDVSFQTPPLPLPSQHFPQLQICFYLYDSLNIYFSH